LRALAPVVAVVVTACAGTSEGPVTRWTWAERTTAWDAPIRVVPLANGDVAVLAWSWTPTAADLGPDPPKMPGQAEIRLVRLDADGAVVAEQRFGGGEGDLAFGLQALPDGGLVVAGQTAGLTLGPTRLAAERLDGFLAWFDADGTPGRLIGVGGSGDERLFGLARLGDGRLVAVGGTSSDAAGPMDALAVAVAPSGDLSWRRSWGGDGVDVAIGATVADDLYLTGVSSSSRFQAGAAGFASAGGFDGWVARVAADGEPAWVRDLGGPGQDFAYHVAPWGDELVLSGVAQAADAANGPWRPFVSRVSRQGDVTPLATSCCVGYDFGTALAAHADSVTIVSTFDGPTLDVGGVRVRGVDDGYTAFIAELDATGAARWATPLGVSSTVRRDFGVGVARVGEDVVAISPLWRDGGYDIQVVRMRGARSEAQPSEVQ
jgi:hypothetical protein